MKTIVLGSFCILFWLIIMYNCCHLPYDWAGILIDGVRITETGALLASLRESFNSVPVTLAVSLSDLQSFKQVRNIAYEALEMGHSIAMRLEVTREWSFEEIRGMKRQYEEILDHPVTLALIASGPLNNLEDWEDGNVLPITFSLDLTPNHINDSYKFIHEWHKKEISSPKLRPDGPIVYLNSFVSADVIKVKVFGVIQALVELNFKIVPLTQCSVE